MREVQASQAKTHFLRLLDEVEGGETIVITRRGRKIARLEPNARRQEEIERTVDSMREAARRNGPVKVDEVLAWRDEGRKY